MHYLIRAGTAVATLALIVVLTGGCSGLEKAFALPEGGGLARFLAPPVTEEDVARALERRSALEWPSRIAVYEIAHLDPGFPPETNLHIDSLLEAFASDPERFRNVSLITSFLHRGEDTPLRLRHAAARSASDLLLVTELDRRVHARPSPLVFLNLLLIGLFLPAETVEVEVRIQGHLIDTASGFFIGSFRGRARGESFVPTLSVEAAAADLTGPLAVEAYDRLHRDLAERLDPP